MNSNFRLIVCERLKRAVGLLSEAFDDFSVSEVMTPEEYEDYLTVHHTLSGLVDSLKY